ncbi:MAG: hypothetical protein P1U57_00350 [Oleibacter sp.]|nr:hypothetical protein [Thalassolituus sp.]
MYKIISFDFIFAMGMGGGFLFTYTYFLYFRKFHMNRVIKELIGQSVKVKSQDSTDLRKIFYVHSVYKVNNISIATSFPFIMPQYFNFPFLLVQVENDRYSGIFYRSGLTTSVEYMVFRGDERVKNIGGKRHKSVKGETGIIKTPYLGTVYIYKLKFFKFKKDANAALKHWI